MILFITRKYSTINNNCILYVAIPNLTIIRNTFLNLMLKPYEASSVSAADFIVWLPHGPWLLCHGLPCSFFWSLLAQLHVCWFRCVYVHALGFNEPVPNICCHIHLWLYICLRSPCNRPCSMQLLIFCWGLACSDNTSGSLLLILGCCVTCESTV